MIALYARVSTEEQAKKGHSLSDQLRACRQIACSEHIQTYVDDGYSGEFLDRPALTQLRQDILQGVIGEVICYDPDRLSRKLMNQLIITEEWEKRGVVIRFVSASYEKTPEGSLFYQMRGAIAEFEKAKINERMSRGRTEKARQGKVVKDYHIYGYSFDRHHAQLKIVENEASIVRYIFDVFTSPHPSIRGMNGIALHLTEQAVPTKRGARVWHRQVVRQILMNHTYTGTFYQNKWNTEGMLANRHSQEKITMKLRPESQWIAVKCPEIISIEQFDRAQALLAVCKRRHVQAGSHSYFLSGLVRCGECGNTMTGRRRRHWSKDEFVYTDVKNTAGARHRGCGMTMKCELLDQAVWDRVAQWLFDATEIASAPQPEVTSKPDQHMMLQIQLERIQQQKKRLIRLFTVHEDLADELVQAEFEQLVGQERILQSQIETLAIHSLSLPSVVSCSLVECLLQCADENEKLLTTDDKQVMMRQVVKEVWVYPQAIEIRSF